MKNGDNEVDICKLLELGGMQEGRGCVCLGLLSAIAGVNWKKIIMSIGHMQTIGNLDPMVKCKTK